MNAYNRLNFLAIQRFRVKALHTFLLFFWSMLKEDLSEASFGQTFQFR